MAVEKPNIQLFNLAGIEDLERVKNLLAAARIAPTFWGNRVVYIRQQEANVRENLPNSEKFDLESVVDHIWKEVTRLSWDHDLTLEQRRIGLDIVDRLHEFSTMPFEEACFLTRFLLLVRHFFSKINPKRYPDFFIDKTRSEFLMYRNQALFCAQFEGVLQGDENRGFNHNDLDYVITYPNRPGERRFCAKEPSVKSP